MKITLFTSNQVRHNYFTNILSNISAELNVIQENKSVFKSSPKAQYPKTSLMKKYFEKVDEAQKKIFGNSHLLKKENINLMTLEYGDLNKCSKEFLKFFLNSDIYLVFGSSYIKGELVDFLVKNKAINIHMGISPYYRGTDCNFWALFDSNPHLVGATIHMLSKGLDSGPMLYHALSEIKDDPFMYTMSTAKSAFLSLVERIKNQTIYNFSLEKQDKFKEIRYSEKNQFNDKVVESFLSKKIDLNSKVFENKLYKDPFFLKNSD